jgi:hypothetical protein
VLTVGVGGCGILTGPLVGSYPATIQIDSPYLSIPDTVQSGVPFVVSIPTDGRVCEVDRWVDVEITQGVVLRPMALVGVRDNCGGPVQYLHEVEVTWPDPGVFVLIISGVDVAERPVALRYEVFARP